MIINLNYYERSEWRSSELSRSSFSQPIEEIRYRDRIRADRAEICKRKARKKSSVPSLVPMHRPNKEPERRDESLISHELTFKIVLAKKFLFDSQRDEHFVRLQISFLFLFSNDPPTITVAVFKNSIYKSITAILSFFNLTEACTRPIYFGFRHTFRVFSIIHTNTQTHSHNNDLTDFLIDRKGPILSR